MPNKSVNSDSFLFAMLTTNEPVTVGVMFKRAMDEDLEVVGAWPSFEGEKLEELLCSEMWYQGKVEEPANVVHLKIKGHWHRLYFDYGIVFWRKENEAPMEFEAPEWESHFKLVNIGDNYDLKEKVVESVSGRVIPKGSEVELRFQGGKSIVFSNAEDQTTFRT